MIPWESTLTPDQINQVASFIKVKLVGTSPANPKAAEGDLFEG
jgi:cytochrome c oxidase cbb3-type subunit 3